MKTCTRFTHETMHIRVTAIWKYLVSPFFLYFFMFNFKVKPNETVIASIYYWFETYPLLWLLLRNSNKHNWGKLGSSETFDSWRETKPVRFLSKNQRILCLSLIITIGKTTSVQWSEQTWNWQTLLKKQGLWQ